MQDAAHLIAEALADRASSRFRRDLRSGAVDLESAIDSGDIPEIISRYWFRSFSQKFPASRIRVDVRSTVQVIKQARNEVEHWTQRNDMDLETARARLTDVAQVLRLINAPNEQREVELIRSRVIAASTLPATPPERPAVAPNPRVSVPSSPSPERRTGEAERIRDYLCQKVNDARQASETSVTFRAGDVHNTLGLRNRHRNVCQVLKGGPFRIRAGVEIARIVCSPPSGFGANLVIEFRILPASGPSR